MNKTTLTIAGFIGALIIGVASLSSSSTPSSQVRGANIAPIETVTSTPDLVTSPTTVPTLLPTSTPTPKYVAPTNTPTPTYAQQPTVVQSQELSNDSYYTNSVGNEVHSPAYSNTVPSGATAICGDGTYSFSQSRRGTCSRHGGVSQWL